MVEEAVELHAKNVEFEVCLVDLGALMTRKTTRNTWCAAKRAAKAEMYKAVSTTHDSVRQLIKPPSGDRMQLVQAEVRTTRTTTDGNARAELYQGCTRSTFQHLHCVDRGLSLDEGQQINLKSVLLSQASREAGLNDAH